VTLGFPSGGDYGLASATIGLVFSIVFGVMWVNM
jgi:Na+/glutamate symporter